MQANSDKFLYPRRRVIRFLLKQLIKATYRLISNFRVEGQENAPTTGPLIVVANHFHFAESPFEAPV